MSTELVNLLQNAGLGPVIAAIFGYVLVKLMNAHQEAMKQQADDHKADMKAIAELNAARLKEICTADTESREKLADSLTQLTVAVKSFNGSGMRPPT